MSKLLFILVVTYFFNIAYEYIEHRSSQSDILKILMNQIYSSLLIGGGIYLLSFLLMFKKFKQSFSILLISFYKHQLTHHAVFGQLEKMRRVNHTALYSTNMELNEHMKSLFEIDLSIRIARTSALVKESLECQTTEDLYNKWTVAIDETNEIVITTMLQSDIPKWLVDMYSVFPLEYMSIGLNVFLYDALMGMYSGLNFLIIAANLNGLRHAYKAVWSQFPKLVNLSVERK